MQRQANRRRAFAVVPWALAGLLGLSGCGRSGIARPGPEIKRFVVAPEVIEEGGTSTLSWKATDAVGCTIEPDVGEVEPEGELEITPDETTTYTLRCDDGADVEVEATATVTVVPPPAIVRFDAEPAAFAEGAFVSLVWETTDTTACAIEPDVGDVPTTGQVSVRPEATTTWTLRCQGAQTTVAATATATLAFPTRILSFAVEPAEIVAGEEATLAWTSENATGCAIAPGVGDVDASGSTTVSPTESTTYTLTCTGLLGHDTATVALSVVPPDPTILSFEATPDLIEEGQSAQLSWSTRNTTSCALEPDIGAVDPEGELQVTPPASTTYTLRCQGEDGAEVDATVDVTVVPPVQIVSFGAEPALIERGESAALLWQAANADTCELAPNIGTVDVVGATFVSPNDTTTYTLTCVGPAGMVSAEATVSVVPPVAISTFSASKTEIEKGESVTLLWAASNAESCNLDPEPGAVATQGQTSVAPTQTTTYVLTCTGPAGSDQRSLEITVYPPVAITLLEVVPTTIETGGSATLRWESENASSCSILPHIGAVFASGETEISPTTTTTYTLTCESPVATRSEEVTLTVVPPVGILDFSADRDIIQEGETVTLSWTTENAVACEIDGGIGAVSVSGSVEAGPLVETTYTLTCQSEGGSTQASVTVSVVPPVAIARFEATPQAVETGGSSELAWEAENATGCTLSGLGDVDTTGTTTVTPSATTTYTLTCVGPAGGDTATVQVVVLAPAAIMSFAATPELIEEGDAVTLEWTTESASYCLLDQGIGQVPTAGSTTVNPTATTTYTLECGNAAGSRTAQVTVTAHPPVAITELTATPSTILAREESTLSWASQNADTCSFDQGIGAVAPLGSLDVKPTATTTYTLTCTGPVRSVEAEVTVTVNAPTGPARIESFTSSSAEATVAKEVTLSWTLGGALETSLVLDPGGTSVLGSEAASVTPYPTTIASTPVVSAWYGLTMQNSESPRDYGTVVWASRSVGDGIDAAESVAALGDGQAALVGSFRSSATFGAGEAGERTFTTSGVQDAFLARYAADGTLLWAVSTEGNDWVYGLGAGIGSDGSAALVGSFYRQVSLGGGAVTFDTGSASDKNALIARYDATGALLFGREGSGTGTAEATAVTILPDGALVAVGWYIDAVTFTDGTTSTTLAGDPSFRDIFLVRFEADGTLAWAVKADGAANDYAYDVDALLDGSVVVCGSFIHELRFDDGALVLTSAGGSDAFAAKLGTDGTTEWATALGGAATDVCSGISAAPDGSVVVAGHFVGESTTYGGVTLSAIDPANGSGKDIAVARLDEEGTVLWAKRAGSTSDDEALDVVALPDGSAAAVGVFRAVAAFDPLQGANVTLSAVGNGHNGFAAIYDGDNGALRCVSHLGPSGSQGKVAVSGVGAADDGSLLLAATFDRESTFARNQADGAITLTAPSDGLDDAALGRLEVPNHKYLRVVYRPVSFEIDVLPLFTSYGCAGCHDAGHALDLTGTPQAIYDELLVENPSRAVPYDPDASLLLLKPRGDLSHGGGTLVTPGDSLDVVVTQWLLEGALR